MLLEKKNKLMECMCSDRDMCPFDHSHKHLTATPITEDLFPPDKSPADLTGYSHLPAAALQADVLEPSQLMGRLMPYNYGHKQIVHTV